MRTNSHWVTEHDAGYAALRRAARTAIVMPAVFAICDEVIGSPVMAVFAVFGSSCSCCWSTSPARCAIGCGLRQRLQEPERSSCVWAPWPRAVWLSTLAMVVVAFSVLFSGVVSSVLAGATTSLLLAFILPVTFPGPLSSIPARLAGWGIASAVSLLAIALLWPAPNRDPLRSSAVVACRALAERLRADVAYILGSATARSETEHDDLVKRTDEAVQALHRTFLATPFRPTGLGTGARSVVRLVDELKWLHAIVGLITPRPTGVGTGPISCPVRAAAVLVLERCADLLGVPGGSPDLLNSARDALNRSLAEMESRRSPHFRSRTWLALRVQPTATTAYPRSSPRLT